MSKIYTDLNTVLTPYATAIKKNASDIDELNGSLEVLDGGINASNFSESVRESLKSIGVSGELLEASDLYIFDYSTESYDTRFTNETTDRLTVENGTLKIPTAFTGTGYYAVFFDENVSEIEYSVEQSTNNYGCYPILSDFWRQGNDNYYGAMYLPVNRTGWNGLYRYWANTKKTQSVSANNKWTAETRVKRIKLKKLSESWEFTFTHTDDTTTVKNITMANVQAGGHFPKRIGFVVAKAISNAFTHYATDFKIWSKPIFVTEVQTAGSPLYDVNWDAWGDSITAGDQAYHYYIAQNTGCIVNNYGVSGDKVSSVLSRFNNNENASGEYITIFAGVNDYNTATSISGFRTSVQNLLSAVIAKAPFSKFGWITPMQKISMEPNTEEKTLEDYVNVIIEECRAKSVPVLDLFHEGNWYGFNSSFSSTVTSDGLHPNASGHALLAKKIQKFLESL